MRKHLYDAIRERRAIRNFKDKEVPTEALQRMMESARWAPSGGNGQAWSFGIIKDQKRREELAKAAGEQMWLLTAPVIIACCAKLQTASEETAFSREVNELRWGKENTKWLYGAPNDYARGLLYSNANNLIPGAHIQLAAKAEGLDTCWIGYLDIHKASSILNLPSEWRCYYLIALGYGDDTIKEDRKLLKDIVFTEQWSKSWEEANSAQEFGKIYYRDLKENEGSEWLRLWGEIASESLAWQTLHHKEPEYTGKNKKIVAVLNGRIVGFLFVEIEKEAGELGLLEDSKCGFVWEFGVVKEHRGKGIAKQLISEAEKWLLSEGISRMEFWSQESGSQKYYEKLGMEKIQSHWQFYTTLNEKIRGDLKKDKVGIFYAFGTCPVDKLEVIKSKYEVKDLYGTPPSICTGYNYKFKGEEVKC